MRILLNFSLMHYESARERKCVQVIDPSSDYAVSNTETDNWLADLEMDLIFGIRITRNQNMSVLGQASS